MNILIIGAGTVGFSLAQRLLRLNHHITVIEQKESLCDEISAKLDVFTITGHGADPSLLIKADIATMDMVIAVTPSDEINLLVCNFAMQNNVPRRIARIKSDIYTANSSCIDLNKLGVTSVIEPEKEVVEKILQYIELPGVTEVANFQSNNILLRGYRVTKDMPIVNKTLLQIKNMVETSPMLIVAIVRNGMSLHPHGNQKLLIDDEIIAIMPRESFKSFCNLVNKKITKLKKIIVSGDSLTAIHLIEALRPLTDRILLVDPDIEHGHFAASRLNKIDILHGDCTDANVLQEIGIEHADCFIAAGEDFEDNIMSCLLAKNAGASMVIAIRNDDKYIKLFSTLGIDHIVNPQDITSNMIVEKIQMVHIGSYLKLKTADIEVQRLKAGKMCPIAGKALNTLDKFIKKSIIIGAIVRGNQIIIPWGQTIIEENDEVIVLCKKEQIDWVIKWFAPNLGAKIASKVEKFTKNNQ
ncbi:MAG: Trk system potassium transporter TrkA [Candidatus Omnitrophica bacterium]|nr:Trk system potassium transporter TrkA [Candidatus Omnitrophota bacterium]